MRVECYKVEGRYNMNLTSENESEATLLQKLGHTGLRLNQETNVNDRTFTYQDLSKEKYDEIVDLAIPNTPTSFQEFVQQAEDHEKLISESHKGYVRKML